MNYSQITDTLFIGTTPNTEDYDTLRSVGVRLVINMRFERPPYKDSHNPPMKALWLPSFDSPLIPIRLAALKKGVKAALETLAEGGKVYVHCAKGIHRGVAMGAAILIAQSYSPEEAMSLIKARRQVADPDIWYIHRRIMRFSEIWGDSGD